MLASLDEASTIDPVLKPVTEDLRTALYQMEEAGRTLGDYASRVEFDPARLAEIEERLAELSTLKRKYGATVDDIPTTSREPRQRTGSAAAPGRQHRYTAYRNQATERQVREQALDLSQRRGGRDAGSGRRTRAPGLEHERGTLCHHLPSHARSGRVHHGGRGSCS